jgi:hypothetical protein
VGTRAGQAWSESSLKETLEERVVPWAKDHYRISTSAQLTLIGMGTSTKAAFTIAQARQEMWPKVWHDLDTNFLQTQFPVVIP